MRFGFGAAAITALMLSAVPVGAAVETVSLRNTTCGDLAIAPAREGWCRMDGGPCEGTIAPNAQIEIDLVDLPNAERAVLTVSGICGAPQPASIEGACPVAFSRRPAADGIAPLPYGPGEIAPADGESAGPTEIEDPPLRDIEQSGYGGTREARIERGTGRVEIALGLCDVDQSGRDICTVECRPY